MRRQRRGLFRDIVPARWRRWGWLASALVGIGLLMLAYGLFVEPRRLVERDHVLHLPHWPKACDGLRVDVVSDIHTGSFQNGTDNLDRIVARLRASDADIMLMAGDYVIFKVLFGGYVPGRVFAHHVAPLAADKRVYAVLGNHDWWKGGRQVSAALTGVGVEMIDNASVPVVHGECRFHLAGLGDELEGDPDIAMAYGGIPADAPVIALMHEPATFARIPERTALSVAGHTHGGQINPFSSPWRTSKYAPHSHWLRGQVRDGGRLFFVTPGIGTSILPVRIGVTPEISRLTLRSQPERAAE